MYKCTFIFVASLRLNCFVSTVTVFSIAVSTVSIICNCFIEHLYISLRIILGQGTLCLLGDCMVVKV